MWLNGAFHLEICNFLVLLASHNYISCHLSHCGIPRQLYFSLRWSYYRGSREAGLANCFTAAGTLLVEGTGRLSLQRSLLNVFCTGRIFPAVTVKLSFFFLNAALPSERATQRAQDNSEAKGLPCPSELRSHSAKMGRLQKVQQGDAFRMLRYWLAPS